jgi:hypothetical protein
MLELDAFEFLIFDGMVLV